MEEINQTDNLDIPVKDQDDISVKDGYDISVKEEDDIPVMHEDVKHRKKTCLGTILKIFKLIFGFLKSVVGLLLILTLYSVVGAYIFVVIESPSEQIQNDIINTDRQHLIMFVSNLTGFENHSEVENQLQKLLDDYEINVINAYGLNASSTNIKWDFQSALFYCVSVFTTIGYGSIVPVTSLGRAVTVVYAIIGIPLALIILANLGKKFTWWIKFVFALGCQIFRKSCGRFHKVADIRAAELKDVTNGTEIRPGVKVYFGYEVDTDFNLNLFWALVVPVAYIFLGAVMYAQLENWTYLEGAYFIFISITTIGFGDFVSTNTDYLALYSIYIFFGLSLLSMSINVATEVFTQQFDKAKVHMEKIKENAFEKTQTTINRAKDQLHKMSVKL